MGLVYVPAGNQKPFKADIFRQFVPRLAGSPSRAGTIAQGIIAGARFAQRHYKLFTGSGSVGVGAGVENLVGQANNQLGETFFPKKPKYNNRAYSYRNASYLGGKQSRRFQRSSYRRNRKGCICRNVATRRFTATR